MGEVNNSRHNRITWHRIMMLMVLCLFAFATVLSMMAKKGRAVSRKVDEKVYLRHADELSYDIYGMHPDAQFLRGNVSFFHKGMHLTCDSAYFYESTNSFQAFGHVRMRQGDTLTMAGDRAYYDGNDEIGHAYGNVVLTHRKSKLYCDTLDYDKMYGIADAYGSAGIKLVEGKDVLTADWGRYFTSSRHSEFYYNVVLTNDNGLRIETDTLHYSNNSSLAHVLGPSVIKSEGSTVQTNDSYYNTRTETSRLFGRSTVVNEGRSITADTLLHNDKTGDNEGFGKVVYNDTINKNMLLSNYGRYNDKTGYGYATDSVVVIDYSQTDSLWMHCDTIRVRTLHINTDSVQREVHCYYHVRAYRNDLQTVCDSLVFLSKDSCVTLYKDPVIWNNGSQLLGEKINIYANDSTVRYAEVLGQALSVEQLNDSVHFNQVSSRDMYAYFQDGKLRQNWAVSNVMVVYYPLEESDSTIIGLNYTETDTLKMYVSPNRKLEKIWMSASTGTLYPMTQTPPEKHKLPSFAWFDYMRPVSKDDIFVWRPKTEGTKLKVVKRREAPKRKM